MAFRPPLARGLVLFALLGLLVNEAHLFSIGLFDAIHHRGQLSVYLRPMGSKVPSIYGPSADDPGT